MHSCGGFVLLRMYGIHLDLFHPVPWNVNEKLAEVVFAAELDPHHEDNNNDIISLPRSLFARAIHPHME